MRNPHEFHDEIEIDDVIKLHGEIDETEQSFYGEVFNIESTDDGIEVDMNSYALPSDEFYTFQFTEQATDEESVTLLLRGRDEGPLDVGRVEELMVYRPRK